MNFGSKLNSLERDFGNAGREPYRPRFTVYNPGSGVTLVAPSFVVTNVGLPPAEAVHERQMVDDALTRSFEASLAKARAEGHTLTQADDEARHARRERVTADDVLRAAQLYGVTVTAEQRHYATPPEWTLQEIERCMD